jgi:hypothetical protein
MPSGNVSEDRKLERPNVMVDGQNLPNGKFCYATVLVPTAKCAGLAIIVVLC